MDFVFISCIYVWTQGKLGDIYISQQPNKWELKLLCVQLCEEESLINN